MPIVLGNTTITGLGVGGLPAGTVNATTLADAAVTRTKLGVSGVPFNTTMFTNNTRTGLSATNNFTLWSVTYNKLSSTSILIAQVHLAFRESVNGEVGFFIKYGTSAQTFTGCSYMENGGTNGGQDSSIDAKQIFNSRITGYTTTGSQTFSIGWNSNNAGNNTPSFIWNPTNTDDNRGRSPGSTLIVWEMEP